MCTAGLTSDSRNILTPQLRSQWCLMSNAKITHAFVTQEEAIEQVLSPKNSDSGVVEQLSHAVQRDSLKMMSTEHEGSADTAWLLRSPCPNAHKEHIFMSLRILTELFSSETASAQSWLAFPHNRRCQEKHPGPLQCKPVIFFPT